MVVKVVSLAVFADIELVGNGLETEWVKLKLTAFIPLMTALSFDRQSQTSDRHYRLTLVLNTQNATGSNRIMHTLIKKSIKNPYKIPSYLIGKLLSPVTRSHWRSGDKVRFQEGGYVTHASNRPEFAASIYYELDFLQEVLQYNDFSHVLEIGCGYGRLSPWISEYGSAYIGIDIDSEALDVASNLYPDLYFEEGNVVKMNFDKNRFNLAVSNTLLHHVPPSVFQDAISNISHVITENGMICIVAATEGPGNDVTWIRDKKEYEDQFARHGFRLNDSVNRDLPWRDSSEWINTFMCFER